MRKLPGARPFTPGKRRVISVVLVLLFSLQASLYCRVKESADKNQDKESRIPFIGDYPADQLIIWNSPFKLNKKSMLLWGGAAVTTAYLITRDNVYHADVQGFTLKNQWVKKSSPVITDLGSNTFNLGLIGSFYLGGVLLKDRHAKETARLSLKSLLHAVVITKVLKLVFRRQRPYVENGVDQWFTDGKGNDYRSFPSGHTSTAWSVATVIAGMYRDKPAVPVICYSLATLVGISRMTENKHWASDVFIGAVLGYAVGRFVLKKHNNRVNIMPMLSSDKIGITVHLAL
jgi:membrane-associated phospholipid phosphatase